MYDFIYWAAVILIAMAATFLLTIVWLDSPTGEQRWCDECEADSRAKHPSNPVKVMGLTAPTGDACARPAPAPPTEEE